MDTEPRSRSTFVTVVAWVFIILSGFMTLTSAFQNVMIRSMPLDQMNTMLRDSTVAGQMPGAARTMFAHFGLFFLAFFVASLVALIASVGLLRRRNWARLLFIIVMCLGIAYTLGGLFLQGTMMSSFESTFAGVAGQDSTFRQSAQHLEGMFKVMRVFMIVFSLGIAAGFGWIAVKLSSAQIRAEFSA